MTQPKRAARRELDPIRIFYSYSHEDRALRDELQKHLALLEPRELIKHWHDRDISAGRPWLGVINKNLEAADIVLLLVSSAFGESEYCRKEMEAALRRSELGVRVIPIIIRSVKWSAAAFKDFQVLPSESSVMSWKDRDGAWTNVAEGIGKVIDELIAEREDQIGLLRKAKPSRFRKKMLSLDEMWTGAEILCKLVERKDNFDPGLLLAANQGGMVTAAVMNRRFRKPVGIVSSAVKQGQRVIKYVSLPSEVESTGKLKAAKKKLTREGILVVDTKLKTGDSAEGIDAVLRREYGEDADIRYAIVLGYGGWGPSRWKVVDPHFRWPIQFRPKGLKTYVAYYTDLDPQDDNIVEKVRP